MARKSVLKSALEGMLASGDIEGIVSQYGHTRGVVRTLIGMTYDKASVSSWRAMDAIGRISAAGPEHKARDTVMRLLWMMREESGTNPWSAAEIVGEIVARNTGPFEDIVPIVITFSEEPIMRAGAMRAMSRIGAQRPELVQEFVPLALEHSADRDPQVRGYAALALGAARGVDVEALLEGMAGDNEPFLFYDGKDLRHLTVSESVHIAPEDYLL